MPEQSPLPGMSSLPRTVEQYAIDTAPIECHTCDCECAREDAIEVDDHLHCRECVHTCERCDRVTTDAGALVLSRTNGERRGSAEVWLCEDCRWQCADCSRDFHCDVETFRNSFNEKICSRCFENYSACERCDCTIHSDDSYYHEDTERSLCLACCQEVESEESGDNRDENGRIIIHGHWHKPRPRFFDERSPVTGEFSALPDAPYFGVEFEVDTQSSGLSNAASALAAGLHPNPFYHCEEDGSLLRGFEIVSKPATWEHWQTVDVKWMEKLRGLGYRSYDTSTCGQHIHVSRSFLSCPEQFTLIAFVRDNRELMKRLSRREEFGYCKLDGYKTATTRDIVGKLGSYGDNDRYEAINMCNKSTIEFRLFRGTLCPQGFRRNLSLVVALVHFARFAANGRSDWRSAEFFAQWTRTKGRKVLGAMDARILSQWIESAIAGSVPADSAA